MAVARRGSLVTLAVLVVTCAVALGVVAAGGRPAGSQSAPRSPRALPALHNVSDLSDERARDLVDEAFDGLGFAPGALEGPQPDDRVFVGNSYVAWIDETGAYGELNGLWWLSPTVSGDRSFSVRAADGRPVNQLVIGEDGDGGLPDAYLGAEHVEMPNGTPEPHQNPTCGDAGGWCSQYALGEAGEITRGRIPWWRVCGPGPLSFTDVVEPIEVTATASSLRLVYEGRIVKMADGTFPWDDPTGCHEDWLFPDGVRRPVHLRVGLELSADDPWVDRTMQVRNPEGNPAFEGPFSFIGGFVLTQFPDPRPEKQLNRYVRPEVADVWDPDLATTLVAGTWNDGYPGPIGHDIVHGWMGQPYWLSAVPGFVNGRSLRLSHIGPSDNLDTGFCMCEVHGAIEMGGGLLHSAPATDAALPIDGGEMSIEAVRRLETAPATVIDDVDRWTPPTTTTTTTTTTAPSTTVAPAPGAVPVPSTPTFTG